jgi:hypothetical protein
MSWTWKQGMLTAFVGKRLENRERESDRGRMRCEDNIKMDIRKRRTVNKAN